MNAAAPGRRSLANGARKVKKVLKDRCADQETWLGRGHLDTEGTSLDPMADENVGQIVFAALTDIDSTISQLAADNPDHNGECDAIAVYFDPAIAPPRTLRDQSVVPDRYAPANYLGIVATFASVQDAEDAANELRQAVAFASRPLTDTAMTDDPVRTTGTQSARQGSAFDSL